jgi:hypothetical protein
MTTDSHLVVRKDNTVQTYSGPDAVNFFRARILLSGLNMWADTGGKMILTRGMTLKRMLEITTGYTGKSYKRKDLEQAIKDLDIWLQTMQTALPIVQSDS